MRDLNPSKTVLTAKRIERLNEVGRYPDARVPGLCFQISRTGGRSWVLRYAIHRKERMLGLGRAELVSVGEARERAWAEWKLILDGTDPVAQKRATVVTLAGLTFQEACDRYIASHEAGWRNKKTCGSMGRDPLRICRADHRRALGRADRHRCHHASA